MSKYLYILDAGHGGINPEGIYTTFPAKMHRFSKDFVFYEGVFNRQIVKRIIGQMQAHGLRHRELAHEFVDTSLSKRSFRANEWQKQNKCILLSIHGNAHTNSQANGWEVWTSPGKDTSDLIANEMYKQAQNILGKEMRMRPNSHKAGQHDKEAAFWILKQTTMPSVLSENGFFTNLAEARLMMNSKFQEKIAQVHVNTMLWCESNLNY